MVRIPKQFGKAPGKKGGITRRPLYKALVPGRVCILLSGSYAGRRVVFVKHLQHGACVVAGPFGVNGVPLRRTNYRLLQPTSTQIDGADKALEPIAKDISMDLFRVCSSAKGRREKRSRIIAGVKPEEEKFFDADGHRVAPATKIHPERAAMQGKIDAALQPLISKVPQMQEYLRCRFSLGKTDYPHMIKF